MQKENIKSQKPTFLASHKWYHVLPESFSGWPLYLKVCFIIINCLSLIGLSMIAIVLFYHP